MTRFLVRFTFWFVKLFFFFYNTVDAHITSMHRYITLAYMHVVVMPVASPAPVAFAGPASIHWLCASSLLPTDVNSYYYCCRQPGWHCHLMCQCCCLCYRAAHWL